MFGHLRIEDGRLFEQLDGITAHLSRGAALLERLLVEPRSASAEIASEALELRHGAEEAPGEIDVRAFTGFAMRMDRMEYRELATSLDAALEAVRDATAHANSLDGSEAPECLRALAGTLSAATAALVGAVPFVRRTPREVLSRCGEIQRLAHAGEAMYYEGVGRLFAGHPDAVHVLRWKDIYEKVRHGLASCARCGTVLEQLTPSPSA